MRVHHCRMARLECKAITHIGFGIRNRSFSALLQSTGSIRYASPRSRGCLALSLDLDISAEDGLITCRYCCLQAPCRSSSRPSRAKPSLLRWSLPTPSTMSRLKFRIRRVCFYLMFHDLASVPRPVRDRAWTPTCGNAPHDRGKQDPTKW